MHAAESAIRSVSQKESPLKRAGIETLRSTPGRGVLAPETSIRARNALK